MGSQQVLLARTLIQNLRNKGVNRNARDLADKLLEKLLRSCTSLLWQPEVLSEMLAALDSTDAMGYRVAVDSRITGWLRKVRPAP